MESNMEIYYIYGILYIYIWDIILTSGKQNIGYLSDWACDWLFHWVGFH